MSSDEIYTYLTSGNVSPEEATKFAREQSMDNWDRAERSSRKLFGGRKAKRYQAEAEKWEAVERKLTGHSDEEESASEDLNEDDDAELTPNDVIDDSTTQDEETPIVDIDNNTITWNINPQPATDE